MCSLMSCDRLSAMSRRKRLEDRVALLAGLDALGVVHAEVAGRVRVVVEPLCDWPPVAGSGDAFAEDGVDQRALADAGLAEDGEVEAAEALLLPAVGALELSDQIVDAEVAALSSSLLRSWSSERWVGVSTLAPVDGDSVAANPHEVSTRPRASRGNNQSSRSMAISPSIGRLVELKHVVDRARSRVPVSEPGRSSARRWSRVSTT